MPSCPAQAACMLAITFHSLLSQLGLCVALCSYRVTLAGVCEAVLGRLGAADVLSAYRWWSEERLKELGGNRKAMPVSTEAKV